jgi:hypothetical protein
MLAQWQRSARVRLQRHLILAAALAGVVGCAATPPPEPEQYHCRVIPTNLVECSVLPRTPSAPGAGAARP